MPVETLSRQSTTHNPDFKKIGYDEKAEIESLFRIININLAEGKSLTEAVGIAAGELELNLRGYNLEIIKQRPVLPHLNRFDIKNRKIRMVGSSGEPVVDAVTAEERNGSVKEASEKVEDFLLFAPNNSLAVLMNPAGWNGFKDAHGREAEPHLNTETMVFWKNKNGVLQGLTLVTDLKEEQAEQVMINLGVIASIPEVGEHERLANIVRNPALISFFGSDINPFEYVLDKILAQRGSGNIKLRQRKGDPEVWSIQEIRRDIGKFEELLLFKLEEESLVTEPKQYILEQMHKLGEKFIQQEIINKIEQAIILLAERYLKATNKFEYYRMKAPQTSYSDSRELGLAKDRDFVPIMLFLRSRGGCSARSGAGRALRGASSVSFGSSSIFERRSGICEECGGNGSDGHYHCPDCGIKYADETNTAPENRTKACACGSAFGCGSEKDNEG